MVLEGITLNWYELIALLVVVPTGITVPLTIWLTRIKTAVDQNHKCIERVEKQIDHNKDTARIAVENSVKLFSALQSEMKAINVSIGVIGDKVATSEKVHTEIRQESLETRKFFTIWIQRIEDLLKEQRTGNMNTSISRVRSDTDIERRLDVIEKILMQIVEKNEKDKMQ